MDPDGHLLLIIFIRLTTENYNLGPLEQKLKSWLLPEIQVWMKVDTKFGGAIHKMVRLYIGCNMFYDTI